MSISNRDNSLRRAQNVGTLNGTRRIRGIVGARDRIDFFKVTLSQVSDFALSIGRVRASAGANIALRDSTGTIIESFAPSKQQTVTRSRKLADGVYYISVQRTKGEVRYDLTASATPAEPGETLATARNIGVLSGTYNTSEFVGTTDPIDIYKFTLNDVSQLEARVDGTSAQVNFQIINDTNGNGLIDSGEVLYDELSGSRILQDLPQGTYYVRLFPRFSGNFTSYSLTLIETPYGGNVSPGANGTLPISVDVGVLSGAYVATDYVGILDPNDIFKFTLNDVSRLEARYISASSDINLQLIADRNNNGLIDSGEILGDVVNRNSILEDLPAGTYFARVFPRFSGTSTSYTLTLIESAYGGTLPPAPNDSLSTAVNVGVLSGTYLARDYVGVLDLIDYFRFTLNSASLFEARYTTSSSDINLQLITDTNNNGLVDSGEIIDDVVNSNRILRNLSAGTYFARVFPRFSGTSTQYSLSLSLVSS